MSPMYASTGLDIIQRRSTGLLGLFDVRDCQAMLQALDTARRAPTAADG